MKSLKDWPFVILLIGCTISLISTINTHEMFIWDEAEYANLAERIATGESYDNALRPPLLPLSGSIFYAVLGDQDLYLKLAVVILGILAVVLLYVLGKKMENGQFGMIAAGSLCFSPSFWQHSTYFLSEVPFILFSSGAILFFIHGIGGSRKSYYLSWLFVGLSFLTRYTALLLGPILIIVFLVHFVIDKSRVFQSLRDKNFWIAPLTAIIVLLPWLFHQQSEHGDLLIGFKIASQQLSVYLTDVRMPWNFYVTNFYKMVGYFLLPLGIVGIYSVIKKKSVLGISSLSIVLFLFIWFSSYRYKELRLITSILPFWSILAAYGYQHISKQWVKIFRTKLAMLSFIFVLGITSYLQSETFFTRTVALGYPTLQQAVKWIVANGQKNDRILGASVPQLVWYSKREVHAIPADSEEFFAQCRDVEWVVLVNYEKGQPDYISQSLSTIYDNALKDPERCKIFRHPNGFLTIVVPSRFVRVLFE